MVLTAVWIFPAEKENLVLQVNVDVHQEKTGGKCLNI